MLQIITDSASDIPQSVAAEWGVTVLPLTVCFGEEEYEDGVTITPSDFYTKLIETDVLPKTSQITPSRYGEAFRRARAQGDEVVAVCLSSELSGSYQSACAAAAEFDSGIEVVDSHVVCCALYILVELAVRLRDQGMNAAQIAAVLREKAHEVSVIALFDTLEYLRMGGRIGGAAAFAGGLLSLKPVLTIREGRIVAIGRARGSRNGNNMLMEYVKKQGGIDFALPICVAWSGNSDELVRKYIEDSRSLYDGFEGEISTTRVGSTIGTYAGPGAVALAFFPKR
ncbi:DegV family protein [Lachnoclostridium sp. Marseille-P6806]|uniref:DegV family protein n=1 Tax=Lachnoclostridium sp. Marseille-P6806 TaxID=2364793 RepID=UPI00103060DD|nr:DegV family protein [Lachnoclostridium sp. Marseille-P6806]